MTDSLPPPDSSKLTDDEVCSRYIELWKQTIEVQKHFNDLEWRIRGLAMTAATFALGASAVAAKDGTEFHGISLGACVLFAGVILWYGFYFVDRYWYHPLLIGSVKHGEKLEDELRAYLPVAGLTKEITAASHIKPPLGFGFFAVVDPNTTSESGKHSKILGSEAKLKIFYLIGAITLLLAAVFLQLAACAPSKKPEPKPERVIEVIRPSSETARPESSTTPGTTPSTTTAGPTTLVPRS